jgi:hypothetical protein
VSQYDPREHICELVQVCVATQVFVVVLQNWLLAQSSLRVQRTPVSGGPVSGRAVSG